MLREYISRKIRENEELIIDLESDIKNGKSRKKELEKLIEILEDENNDGSEIFSPRNHREQNLDKLKHYQEDLKKISEEIEDKLNKLSETKKKRSEYKSMLAETEKIHQEEEAYKDIDYQVKNNLSAEKKESEDLSDDRKTEQRLENDKSTDDTRQLEQAGTEQHTEQLTENREDQLEDSKTSGYTEQGEIVQEEQQAETEINQRKDNEGYAGQSETEQMEQTAEDQNENHKERRKEGIADGQTENQTKQKEGGKSNGEIKQQSNKNLIQTKEQDLEYEEQEIVPSAMDTKIIIQKSIEDIVKRIESKEGQNFRQPEQKHETKQKNKNNDIFEKIRTENRTGRNLDGIEIKSGELIVLESERKKEKEFLEKIKKNLDLCFIYSGNRSKCRNELIKVKKMIESYISSIE